MRWTAWLPGIVVAGHGVASGRAKQDEFPGGAIRLQTPVFACLGVDLTPFHPGTINVDVSPHRVAVTAPRHRLERVEWLDGYPAETFSFVDMEIRVGGTCHDALLFYPHPETKPEHFQDPGVLEVLAAYIDGVAVGDVVEVRLAAGQVEVSE
jgi:hypothetical protein